MRGWFYGWDITEVTNPDAHEYAIYRLGDGDDGQTEPLRVAESFEHFIVDVLCDGRFELSEPGKGRRYQINYNQDQDATGFSFHADYPDQ